MGNNQSAAQKTGRPGSPSSGGHRKDASGRNNMIPGQAAHRSGAPAGPSLAEAQGSTAASRPKSIPNTAVSSLSPSPHSSLSASAAKPIPVAASSFRDEPSKPVDVPTESTSVRASAYPMYADAGFPDPLNSVNDAYLTRPPRLPLPIEEEVHTPGSPILGPDDAPEIEENSDSSAGLTRKSSITSAATLDDDDSQELRVDRSRPTVPTRIEWKRGGEKVYVTGTIFQWNRKQRLHPIEGKPDHFAGVVHAPPGTHHIRFVVDSVMQTSPDLPTTVDFGNNLVNYIEVSPEEALKQPLTPAEKKAAAAAAEQAAELPKVPRTKLVLPPEMYQKDIPQYLLDFDQSEDSPAYQSAIGAIEKLPTPPSLPGFLSKPILNAATLMKDDNSVLNMPNHTVLNHLATSSIKNNVLAVSATTRYRSKYVTTIIYKPTSADEG